MKTVVKEKVVVLGASPDSGKYSNQAVELLSRKGHEPIPVHPNAKEILGFPCFSSLDAVKKSVGAVDTLTMYVNAAISTSLESSILKLKPRRIIFNPGSENSKLAANAEAAGIDVEEACTLVLLRTGQF